MPYNTKPTAEYVHEFAKERQEHWGQKQTVLDEFAWKLVTRQARPSVATATGDVEKVDTMLSGYGGQLIKQDLNTLGIPPMLKVNPINDKISTRRKVDGLLEPWLNGAWRQSQVEGKVWRRAARDLRLYGRSYSAVSVSPRLYSEGDYKRMVEELVKYTKGGDYEEADRVTASIRKYERSPSNFPLRWSYYDARSVFPSVGEDRPFPELVVVRKMTAGDIADAYGEDKLPRYEKAVRDAKGKFIKRGTRELSVYHYWNYGYYACVIGDDDDPQLVNTWEHGMDENPVVVMEGDLLPEGQVGARWESALFDFQDVLLALDRSLSDIGYQTARYTRGQVAMFLDPEARGVDSSDPRVAGHPESIVKITPNDPFAFFYTTERVGEMPVPKMNQDQWLWTNWLNQYVNTIALRPVEQGRLPNSQTNAAAISMQLDESYRRLHPVNEEMEEAARKVGRLLIKSAEHILEQFPQMEKIYVHTTKDGNIGAAAGDLAGYSTLISPRFSDLNTVNELQNTRIGQMHLAGGIDPVTVYEKYWGYENGQQMLERSQKYRLQEAYFQSTVQQVQQLQQQLASRLPAGAANRMSQQLPNLPPEVWQVLAEDGLIAPFDMPQPEPIQQPMGAGPGTQPDSMGAMSQMLANVGRAGSPEMPMEGY